MKLSQFRTLIREEIRKVLKEGKFNVGDIVTDINGDMDFQVKFIFKNKQEALAKLKSTLSPKVYAEVIEQIEELYSGYKPVSPSADNKTWYSLDTGTKVPLVLPASHTFAYND
jgi:hypothetical protein